MIYNLNFKDKFTREQWDALKTKEALYAAFDVPDGVQQAERARLAESGPNLTLYYADEEFPEIAKKLKKAAETLRPILEDIAKHLPAQVGHKHVTSIRGGNSKACSDELLRELDCKSVDGLPVLVWLLLLALDDKNPNNIIKCIETGNGIPQARAAYRAYQRYKAFKEADEKQLAEFKDTEEYKLQQLEIRLGIRKEIELPQKIKSIINAFM